MDAYSSHSDISYSSSAPVLLAANSGSAFRRAESTLDASGLRVGARLSVQDALSRLKIQPSAKAVWVELDHDDGDAMDELVARVSHDAARGLYGAVLSVTPELVDPVTARLDDSAVEFIAGADEVERAAALALAIARQQEPHSVYDAGSDRSAERLRQLSEEVGRIASTLARLSSGPAVATTGVAVEAAAHGTAPPVSAETVRSVIRARRIRSRYFSEELFADPAWDMLLDLLQAEIAQLRVPVSSLCIAAAVPATTALRWLKTLVNQGLFLRRPDPHDGRRVYVELAPDTSNALRRYFAEVGQVAAI